MGHRRALVAVLLALAPTPLLAQTWNSERTTALVSRGITRRSQRRADSSLVDYRVRAHGFVFFLGQFGEGFAEPPRLVKSDELVLEVYWKAPNRSKQRIIGWRDRADLPTDIQYHRDHLGIVQNNFADHIRLGEGQEVRDVPHPLSRGGPGLYDYALTDSLSIRLPQREVRVYEVRVRPKDFGAPRVVGSLYFDRETAELIIFRFNFTRSAYLDDTLEDITIVLENGLWEGRYWLPRRQEIEIRRRTKWLDLPARGIIRGRWEIRDYQFNVGLSERDFRGPEIVAAPDAVLDTFAWDVSLDAAIKEVAGPAMTFDLEQVRLEIEELAGSNVLSGLAAARPSIGSISELVRFNRVEGLALGLGGVVRPGGDAAELRGWISYGVSDQRLKGLASLRYQLGRTTLGLTALRRVEDVGVEPVISGLLNSVLAQELGKDYGDYVLADRLLASLGHDVSARGRVTLAGGVERTTSLEIVTEPASGSFDRPNPPLGSGTFAVGALRVERRDAELAVRGGVSGELALEAGAGDSVQYVRVRGAGRAHAAVGVTSVVLRTWAGWGSADLPPHRSFVMGGRGTLVGEPFREWGGRYALHGHLEWRLPVPVPALTMGAFANTGRRIVVAPFVSAGWAGGAVSRVPWRPSEGVRVVAGLGLELFHRLFRADLGVSLRGEGVSLVVDLTRDLWPIL
jgi:hypothetical protein